MKNNKITLDEIIEFTESNGYEIIDEAWNGILYRGSDGEEVYEDEIIEMIEAKKAKPLDNFFGDVSGALNKLSIIK